MAKRPGRERVGRGPVGTAISTATVGNATAFGFSITITGSFGMLQALVGSPSVGEIVMFGAAAAVAIGVVEGVVTRGFRARPGAAPPEVRMLGTALGFISVAAGLGTAAAVGSLLESGAAWPIGAAAAALVFLATESAETLAAEEVQKRRGDPEAEQEREAG